MKKTVVYIGNDLGGKSGYRTMHEMLTDLLRSEGYRVISVSDKSSKCLRLADMLYTAWRYRKADYFLIDTYSTLNFFFAFFVSQLLRILGRPYFPILHGGNLPARLKKSPRLSRMIFARAQTNIAPSKYLYEVFHKAGFPVCHIPNSFPVADYPFLLRENLRPRLLWVRAFAGFYLPENAVEVLRLLKEKYPGARLCMIGPDRDGSRSKTEEKIKAYGLENDVELTGVMSKEAWHRKARDFDIFINTTSVDNTPVSVMEAMALGLPVVSTNAGGLPYLIDDGRDGLLVPVDRPGEMARAVEFLLENPGKAVRIARQARRKIEQLDWTNIRLLWKDCLK